MPLGIHVGWEREGERRRKDMGTGRKALCKCRGLGRKAVSEWRGGRGWMKGVGHWLVSGRCMYMVSFHLPVRRGGRVHVVHCGGRVGLRTNLTTIHCLRTVPQSTKHSHMHHHHT